MTKRKILLPVGIVMGGIAVASMMIASGGSAEKAPPEVETLPVTTLTMKAEDLPIPVRGTGVVKAAQQVSMMPQVSGQIVQTDPNLMPGARYAEGKSSHKSTTVTTKRWSRNPAATFSVQNWSWLWKKDAPRWQPRVGNAQSKRRTANGSGTAQTPTRPRTTEPCGSPNGPGPSQTQHAKNTAFSAVQCGCGERKHRFGSGGWPGTVVATLVGTDALWVTVSLPMSEVDVLQFQSRDGQGSAARVLHRLANDKVVEHAGVALQLGGALDPQTRLAQVTVSVPNAFDTVEGKAPCCPAPMSKLFSMASPPTGDARSPLCTSTMASACG